MAAVPAQTTPRRKSRRTRVGSGGRLVIPAEIREQLGLKEGTPVVMHVEDGELRITNFDEVLRVIDSLQLTAKHKVATPVNWKQGEDVIIAGSVSDEEAKKTYPDGWKAPKPYIRIVPHPTSP